MELLRHRFQGTSKARIDPKSQRWLITIPKVFSLIRNPVETLDTIYSMVEISRHRPRSIFFDHSQVEDIDIGASVVFDIVAVNLWRELSKNHFEVSFGGTFPENPLLYEFIKAMGITRHLCAAQHPPSAAADELFVQFPLYRGYAPEGSQITGPQHREKAASLLVKYLNECLETAGYQVSDTYAGHILKWAGEIITNAEEHSGEKQWYTIGCMKPRLTSTEKGEDFVIGECELAIFGFGKSIYQSLSGEDTPGETRSQVEHIAQNLTPWYKISPFGEGDIWTLCALQDGVSRFSQRPGESTRGKGTVEMIEAFQQLGKTIETHLAPEMTLISGSTRIYFNDRYHLKDQAVADGQRKIIAFNSKNSLETPPDPKHVHSISGHFPGTLLTFRFFVDGRYLDKMFNNSGEASEGRP